MKKDNNMEIAYWRDQKNGKCTFCFNLNYKRDKLEVLQYINAVINIDANISNLLSHIRNKIKYYVKQTCKELKINIEDYEQMDINLVLRSDIEPIDEKVTCKDVLQKHHKLIFEIFEQTFMVKLNAPLVMCLALPDLIVCDTEISPIKYKFFYVDKNRSDFLWYRSKDKDKWQFIDNGWEHKISKRDVNYYLKILCKPSNLIHNGPELEAISKHVVYEAPEIPKCPFEDRHEYTKEYIGEHNFRIMTYNILSDRYCKDDLYGYCEVPYLSIEYRKKLLIKEIMGYHADIICLQEVDENILNTFYGKTFRDEHYLYQFNRKGNTSSEGLLIAFRDEKLECLFRVSIIYGNVLLHHRLFKNLRDKLRKCNLEVFKEMTNLGTSLQLICLKFRHSQQVLLIANTHLYYHPECDHIRLLQLQIAFLYIEKEVVPKFKDKFRDMSLSIVFCGDFNSNPDRDSYKLFINSCVTKGPTVRKIYKNGHTVKHSIQFTSAYGTPQFTNYTGDFKGCLDYIFYEHEKMRLIQTVPLPEESVLSENTALPSLCFPSDHLALIADFEVL